MEKTIVTIRVEKVLFLDGTATMSKEMECKEIELSWEKLEEIFSEIRRIFLRAFTNTFSFLN